MTNLTSIPPTRPSTSVPPSNPSASAPASAPVYGTSGPQADRVDFDFDLGAGIGPAWWRPEVQQWLVQQRNAGATPADIASMLVAAGWDADAAADAAQQSLRKSDRHRALYGSLCWSLGLGALGLATGFHQLLADTPDPSLAALAFTLAVVLLPLAGWCAWTARTLEAVSPHAVWSSSRRKWFGTLAALTAAIGLIRLITYVYFVIAAMTGARATPLSPNGQFQVLVSLAVLVPLFSWSLFQWRTSDVVISGLRENSGQQAR